MSPPTTMAGYFLRIGRNIETHAQKYLTAIWLISFALSLGVANSYVGRLNDQGQFVVPPDERWACVQPLIVLYSAYVAGILIFWFTRPFKRPLRGAAAMTRAVIALLCTVFFVAVILYLISINYLHPSDPSTVVENIALAVKVSAALSFIVAPINFYYFGMKSPRAECAP